jgi:hypothetical protein
MSVSIHGLFFKKYQFLEVLFIYFFWKELAVSIVDNGIVQINEP